MTSLAGLQPWGGLVIVVDDSGCRNGEDVISCQGRGELSVALLSVVLAALVSEGWGMESIRSAACRERLEHSRDDI